MRRRLIGIAAAGFACAWLAWLGPQAAERLWRPETVRLLESPRPHDRKWGAWKSVEHPRPAAIALIIRGLTGGEPDPDVREAYVYTLGRISRKTYFPVVELVVETDPSPYVRAAAWLAAVRIDRERTGALLERLPIMDTPWDRIGRAQARLLTGDTTAFDELLWWAEHGDVNQRRIASQALTRWLVPVLDAVGRWPVHVEPKIGQSWPIELVREIRRRCTGLNLQAIAHDIVAKGRQAKRLRRNVWRITHARDAIVVILTGRKPAAQ